jgi:hypothetical protein
MSIHLKRGIMQSTKYVQRGEGMMSLIFMNSVFCRTHNPDMTPPLAAVDLLSNLSGHFQQLSSLLTGFNWEVSLVCLNSCLSW